METGLVTCMYNGLSDTKYGGRNRENMYKDSLSSIAASGLPIFCFVFPQHVSDLQIFFDAEKINNIKIIGHDIFEEDFHAPIQNIKQRFPEIYGAGNMFWEMRCPEIMFGKTRLLKRIINENSKFEKVYWIDAGLSNASILRHKYFPRANILDHYNSENFFTSQFFDGLNRHTSDGLFAALHTNPNNTRIPSDYNETEYSNKNYAMIGGLFGGNVNMVSIFCDKFEKYITKMLGNNVLYSEESAYTGIVNDNPAMFAPIFFDTFYHEDWKNVYNDSDVSFSQILEKFLVPDSCEAR